MIKNCEEKDKIKDIIYIGHLELGGGKDFSHASVFIIYVDISKLGLPFRRKAPSK